MSFLSPPKIPSVASQVAGQVSAAKQISAVNHAYGRPNTTDIYGNKVSWTQTGTDANGNPTFSATNTPSAENAAAIAKLFGAKSGVGTAGQNLATNIGANYGDIPDFGTAASSLTNQMLTRHNAYMDPYRKQQIDNFTNMWRNQGLDPAGESYNEALRKLLQTQDESQGQFLNSAQAQAFRQAVENYQIPVDTVEKIMKMMGPLTGGDPNVAGIGQAQAPNVAQIAQNNYQAKLAQNNALWSGIAGIGSTILGMPGVGAGLGNMLGLGQNNFASMGG